jgi:hypothetical protein
MCKYIEILQKARVTWEKLELQNILKMLYVSIFQVYLAT